MSGDFYYYDDQGKCLSYNELHLDLKRCYSGHSSGTVNGFTAAEFSNQIQADYTSFMEGNPQILATLSLAFGIAILSQVLSKK